MSVSREGWRGEWRIDTCGGDAVKADEGVEAGSCSSDCSLKPEREEAPGAVDGVRLHRVAEVPVGGGLGHTSHCFTWSWGGGGTEEL